MTGTVAQEEVYVRRTEGPLAWLVLNQPRKKNAISAAMMDRLSDLLLELDADPEVLVIILRGEGDNFSSGGDLKQTAASPDPLLSGRLLLRRYLRATRTIRDIATPVVVMADGYAVGGAFSLMLAADLVCVSDRVQVIPAFCAIGIAPEMGMMRLLPDVVGEHRAKEILFLNRGLGSEDLVRMGIANRSFPADDLVRGTEELALAVAAMPSESVQITKEIMNAATAPGLDAVLAAETTASPFCASASRTRAAAARRQYSADPASERGSTR